MSIAQYPLTYQIAELIVNGAGHFTAGEMVAAVLILTHVTIAAVTIFLHRHQSHRALELHPVIAHFFRFWLWLTTGMLTKHWVAIHRKHHACVETADDPHSPQVFGIKKVLWQGAELYRSAAHDKAMLERFGNGTPNDWIERSLYSRYPARGIVLMFIIDILIFGLAGISVWAVQMLWIPLFAAGVVNGVGHFWGYRNFESADSATNISPLGLLIGGEELHNNHHAFPTSAKLSSKWWEFDIGWCYIRLLAALGLANVQKLAPTPTLRRNKGLADLDTMQAVIRNHMHVMASYTRNVVATVHREEQRRAADPALRGELRRMRQLLVREQSRLDAEALANLQSGLALSHSLHVVYQFKQRLQGLWRNQSLTHDSALQELRKWCLEADASGIRALQEFARTLPCYTLRKV